MENITRHLEAGMNSYEAAMLGSREIGFTVASKSITLIAVFILILLMEGIVGRQFREFAITLFGLDNGVADGLADDNADVERARFLKSHASQKPQCGELSQPGFEPAGS